jgi:hypothetical protein
MNPPPEQSIDDQAVVTQAQLKRERLRFTNFQFGRTPQGNCHAEVELEWLEGQRVKGKAEGTSSAMGDLRVSAEAALNAIRTFSEGALDLELVGVKALRVFDANVVIVAISRRGDATARLLGCYLAEADPIRASVIAVLNATNRILGNFIATR